MTNRQFMSDIRQVLIVIRKESLGYMRTAGYVIFSFVLPGIIFLVVFPLQVLSGSLFSDEMNQLKSMATEIKSVSSSEPITYSVVDPTNTLNEQTQLNMIEQDLGNLFKMYEDFEQDQEMLNSVLGSYPDSTSRSRFLADVAGFLLTERRHGTLDPDPSEDESSLEREFALWWLENRNWLSNVRPGFLWYFKRIQEVSIGNSSEGRELLADGAIEALIVIPNEPLKGLEGGSFTPQNIRTNNLKIWYEAHLNRHLRTLRFDEYGISETDRKSLMQSSRFPEIQATSGKPTSNESVTRLKSEPQDEESDGTSIFERIPAFLLYTFLAMAIMIPSIRCMTNTLEEKSNKLGDMFLSTMYSDHFFFAKVAGTGLPSFLSTMIWTVLLLWIFSSLGSIVDDELFKEVSRLTILLNVAVYYLLCFLLLGPVFCALGSLATNMKSLQTIVGPVTLVLLLTIYAGAIVIMAGGSLWVKWLSYIPFVSPFFMFVRYLESPAWWEYVATTLMTIVCIWLLFRLFARLFERGLLMEGETPKPWQIAPLLRKND